MRAPTTSVLFMSLLYILAQTATAAVPLTLTQHGYLQQAGSPVEGSLPISFRLYTRPDELTPFWEETVTVSCAAGYYSVVLGVSTTIDPADLLAATQPVLGLVIDGGDELTPRLPLASVPSAMLAAVAADLQCNACIAAPEVSFSYAGSTNPGGPALDLACSDACISTGEIQNGAVTASRLADGAVLTELLDNDGASSGLDADLLDGRHADSFAPRALGWVRGLSGTQSVGGAAFARVSLLPELAITSRGGPIKVSLQLQTSFENELGASGRPGGSFEIRLDGVSCLGAWNSAPWWNQTGTRFAAVVQQLALCEAAAGPHTLTVWARAEYNGNTIIIQNNTTDGRNTLLLAEEL